MSVATGDSSADSSWTTEQLAVMSRGLLMNVMLEYLVYSCLNAVNFCILMY